MKAKKKGKKRGPYKCAFCREYGHRVDKCDKKAKAETILDRLPPEAALALIPEPFQVLAVVEGQTHAGLLSAIEGNQKLAAQGEPRNNSMVIAWGELARRAANVSKDDIERARAARAELLRATEAYEDAQRPIRAALGTTATTSALVVARGGKR